MMALASLVHATLQGRRILVAEDEYMIAEDIAGELSKAGAVILGPVSWVQDAKRLIAAEDRIDGALLDVNLNNEAVWPVAEKLLLRGVPMLLATGYDASAIPTAYLHLPRCQKPVSGQELARAMAAVLSDAARH